MLFLSQINTVITKNFLFFPFLLLFLILLARNPFSLRTLIPNLEPFPDSFHYVDPAFTFLKGKGFFIEREGRTIRPSVPPFYSALLVPVFLIVPDVRAFYFVNVILSVSSLVVFYMILLNLFERKSIQFLLLLLYTTSPPLSWFPQLAMAENCILLVFLSSVYLLSAKTSIRKSWLAGFLAVAFYATKYASLPLALTFPILYAMRFLELKKTTREKNVFQIPTFSIHSKKHALYFFFSLLIFGGLYLLYEYLVKGNNVIGGLFGLFLSVFFPKPVIDSVESSGGTFFSTQFMGQNIRAYTGWLLGNPITVLWKQIIILPKLLAGMAMIGLVFAVIKKKTRFFAFSLLAMMSAVIAFMSVFYAYDGRYFIIAIPTVFLGMGFFWESILRNAGRFFPILKIALVVFIFAIFALNARQLKFTIALNLKYSETPWFYISIRTFDEYIKEHSSEFTKKPVMISSLAPYLIDAYATQEFTVLPLDAYQEFRSTPKQAWGEFDFENLDGEYEKFLRNGHDVFLTKYGLGNEKFLQDAFTRVQQKFHATKVLDGCFDLCTVYKLSLPIATQSAQHLKENP